MTPPLILRTATPDDAEALTDLYTHLSPGAQRCPLDLARTNITKLSQFEGSAVIVAAQGADLIASCTLIVIPNLTRGGAPYGLIENVVTHVDHRGQGHGKAILKTAVARAWEQGCYKVMLSTGSKAPAVLAFYESAGLEQSRTGFQIRRQGQTKG